MPADTTTQPEVARLVREAMEASRSGDKASAHALFRVITKIVPENESAWLWLANTAANPADAVDALRSVLRLNYANAPAKAALPAALLQAGIAAAKANDRPTAVALLAEATEAAPDSEVAWLWRAGVTENPTKALEFLDRVLRLNPDNAQAKQGVARLSAQLTPLFRCPVCDHSHRPNDTINEVCSRCGSVMDLLRPEAFDRASDSANQEVVQVAVRRLRSQWSVSPTAHTAYSLGLAYLNLGYADEGIQALRIAVRNPSADPTWQEVVDRLVKHRRARATAPTGVVTQPKPRTAVPQVKVMVVDDSATVRKLVATILLKAGYGVIEAADAEEAAALVRDRGVPRLFILDVNMPGTDGFGLCKHLRADADTARVPVVFLTGKTGLLNKIHGRWVGAAEYITKPFQPEQLLSTVTRLVPLVAKD